MVTHKIYTNVIDDYTATFIHTMTAVIALYTGKQPAIHAEHKPLTETWTRALCGNQNDRVIIITVDFPQ